MFRKMNFITGTSLRVIAPIMNDPMREFYQREVARMARVSVGATNQILKVLADKEIVTKERRGRMFFYRYNLKNPVAKQLKIFFNVGRLDELVKQLREISKRIILFGSCAEGTDVKDSDIDLFVLTDEKARVREAVDRFRKRTDRRISPILLNANEFVALRSKDKPLHDRILRGIVLWQVE